MRRSTLILVVWLLAQGCDLPVVDAPDSMASQVSLAVVPDSTVGDIDASVDQLRLRITRPDGFARDTTLALAGVDGSIRARLGLFPREAGKELQLAATLLAGTVPLYMGSGTVGPQSDGVVRVGPVFAALAIVPPLLNFDALGDSVRLQASALFTNGTPVPGLTARWASGDPEVISVTGDGLSTSIANGETTLQVTIGPLTGVLQGTVRQKPSDLSAIEPFPLTLAVGESQRMSVAARDRLGHPLARQVQWTWAPDAKNDNHITVDAEGVLLARGPGTTIVSAKGEGLTVRSTLEVVSPSTNPPVLAWIQDGFLRVGNLAGSLSRMFTGFNVTDVSWAPDHRGLAFVSHGDLYRTDLNGRPVLIHGPITDSVGSLEYSADGQWIYYDATPSGGESEVRRVRLDGSGEQVLATGNASSPTSSPDGTRVAYARGDLLMVREIGGDESLVTERIALRSPAWSPDGKWIAYGFGRGGGVAAVTPDGSTTKDLYGAFHWWGITWSPDGLWVLGMQGSLHPFVGSFRTGEYLELPWTMRHNFVSWWR